MKPFFASVAEPTVEIPPPVPPRLLVCEYRALLAFPPAASRVALSCE